MTGQSEPVRILISVLPGELRAAVARAGILEDLLVLRSDRPHLNGNIYRGRVTQISTALDAAFVDIGLPQPGFLPRGEAPGRKQLGHVLAVGDALTVKVVREADEDKGPRLTARITNPPENLEEMADTAVVPSRLVGGEDPLLRLILRQGTIDCIRVDDSETVSRLADTLALQGRKDIPVSMAPALRPLFELEDVEEQIEALLDPRVPLPGGGSLLIEPGRTLTAIDVNLGGMAAAGSAEVQASAVNMKAVTEIARQLRLRAIAGLIVVDFLELKDKKARAQLLDAVRDAVRDDFETCQVAGLSASGLLEMTRRRGGPTLAEILTEPAGELGSGRRRRPATRAFEALRRALGEAGAAPAAGLVVRAAPPVLAALRDGPVAEARRVVEARLGRAIRFEVGGEELEIFPIRR